MKLLINLNVAVVVCRFRFMIIFSNIKMEETDTQIDLDFSLKTIFSDFSLNDLDLLVQLIVSMSCTEKTKYIY